MPTQSIETFDSRERVISDDNPSWTLKFKITGTEDEQQAENLARTSVPDEYYDLILQTITMRHLGGGVWECDAMYGKREKKEPGSYALSFSTQGGSQHITQSLQTVSKYASSGASAPDFSGAIGYNGEEIEGVDVVVPVFSFSITKQMPGLLVTNAYVKNLANLTGTVNNSAFNGFDAGEVLFNGASGAKSGKDDWEITFDFSAAGNQTGLKVGNISGISKRGWEYLWVLYEDAIYQGFLIKRPKAVFVEQVYRMENFASLGI